MCRGNADGLRPQLTGMPERVMHTDDGLLSLFRHEEPTSLLAAASKSLRGKAGSVSTEARLSRDQDFEQFWKAYPRKVGKLAARKAFDKAMKYGVTLERLLEGVSAYVKHKPSYADFCHASTWLMQGRWMDEWDAPESCCTEPKVDWFDECRRVHDGACGLDRWRHMTRMQATTGV